MGMSKGKKAYRALQERVNTVELNTDLIKRAVGEESFLATVKCKDEIKEILLFCDRQAEQIRALNKKVCSQRGQIKVLRRKSSETDI